MTEFNWKISGAAGEGIKVSGLILAQTAFRQGYYVHGYTEYPSLIRGGLNTFQVAASTKPIFSQKSKFDLEISLTDKTLVAPKNIYALGLSCAKLGLKLTLLLDVIKENFAKKSPEIIELNLTAAESGYKSVKAPITSIELPIDPKRQLLNGNEAIVLGAINGGLEFYSAYPMTPVTAILHLLAAKSKTEKIIVHHAEDEIGVINMAIGAGYSGKRAMVATSGGGFCLMTEGIGLSAVAEIPLVIVLGMRPGPATGMPTWSGQGDLLFSINASQDEFPRIILTPGDTNEAFTLTALAQNLAEKYRLPVIILTDKNLSESYYTGEFLPEKKSIIRYPFEPKFVNSYEHDEAGFSTEDSQERIKQVNNRLAKSAKILADPDLPQPQLFGPEDVKTTLISWGSTKGPISEAIKDLPQVNHLHFSCVWPFPREAFLKLIKSGNKLICVENNSTGQLAKLIAQETGILINNKLLKYDGRPFYPEEIIDYVKKH